MLCSEELSIALIAGAVRADPTEAELRRVVIEIAVREAVEGIRMGNGQRAGGAVLQIPGIAGAVLPVDQPAVAEDERRAER